MLNAITQQAEAADRRLRAAVLAHLAELGPPPDPAVDAEALTWWAARLLCTQAREKLQVCIIRWVFLRSRMQMLMCALVE